MLKEIIPTNLTIGHSVIQLIFLVAQIAASRGIARHPFGVVPGWLLVGAPGGNRTHNLGLRSALLCPFELLGLVMGL